MKKLFTFLIAFCLMAFNASSQVVDVVTGLSSPTGMAIDGNHLYFSSYFGNNVSVVDVSSPTPMATVVSTVPSNPWGVFLNGNDLYVASYGAGVISKIDISATNPTPSTMVSGISGPTGLALKGDELYFAEYNAGRISKVDLTQATPTVENVATGLSSPYELAFKGNTLFFTQFDGDLVSKINVEETNPTVESVFSLPSPTGIIVDGNFLYVGSNTFPVRIVKYDLNTSGAMPEDVTTDLTDVRMFGFSGLELFIAQFNANKISKIEIGQPDFPSLGTICNNIVSTDLGGASPTGGTYSGPGVTDNGNGETFTFNPAAAGGPGTYTITYTAINGQTTTSTLTVVAAPTVTFAPPASVTIDAGTQTLNGMPAGGTYSGPGVTGNSFNPMTAGLGTHTITYTFTAANGCSGTVSATITVNANLPADNACGGANDINSSFDGALNEPQVTSLWDNTGYTSTGDPTTGIDCFYGGDGLQNTVWYSFTGDGNSYRIRSVQCTATNYNSDTQVAIYSGNCSNLTPVACNDDEDGGAGVLNISVEVTTQVGVTYYMLIDGYNGGVGEFCLEVTNLSPNAVTEISSTDIEIFPNPTTGEIQLTNVKADQIQLFDSMGRLVFSKEKPGSVIDISKELAGIYFLKIWKGEEVYSARVVKK